MEQLSVDFDRIVTENKINIYAFCEGVPMEQLVCMCWMKWIFLQPNTCVVFMLFGASMFSCCLVLKCAIWVL
jgi:hypothetical protein